MIIDKELLRKKAIEAVKCAYAPYSHYKVGAALLTKSGKIYTGCNIENASYSPTVCAERVAFFKAVSDCEYDFVAIAVAGGENGIIEGTFPPCGVCRQVMREFCNDDFAVLLCTKDSYEEAKLKDLLPFSFGKEKINIK